MAQLVGLCSVDQRSGVWFQVRAHACIEGLVPGRVPTRGNRLMFLSLSSPLPKKKILKEIFLMCKTGLKHTIFNKTLVKI